MNKPGHELFITFDGAPLPGRVPPEFVLLRGPVPTPDQERAIASEYRAFATAVRLSLAPYHAERRVLADGTTLAMESNQGIDRVLITTTGATTSQLTSLFFAVPAALGTYWPDDSRHSDTWKFRKAIDAPEKLTHLRVLNDQPDISQHPGNLTWWNADLRRNDQPIVVSWFGRATRYGRMDYYGFHLQRAWSDATFNALFSPADSFSHTAHRTSWDAVFKPAVWTNGVKHPVYQQDGDATLDVPVLSAALKQEGAGLFLYVVSHVANQLCVFKSVATIGDVYRPGGIRVAFAFNIDFRISTTPLSSSNPQWETLLQPLYFNASCTRCAGLVSVKRASTVNPAAYAVFPSSAVAPVFYNVALCQVDLVAQTTTYDATAASEEEVRTKTQAPDPVTRDHLLAGTPASTTASSELRWTRYAAVDFKGDALVVAMTFTAVRQDRVESGTASLYSPDKTGTMTVSSRWRAFRLDDDTTLAERAEVVAGTSAIHVSGTSTLDINGNITGGTSSGSRAESMSLPVFSATSIEGGDLRHDAVVVLELMEVGEHAYSDSLTATGGSARPWVTTAGDAWSWSAMTFSGVLGKGRHDAARLSIWRNGLEVGTGPVNPLGAARASRFGYLFNSELSLPPDDADGNGFINEWLTWSLFAAGTATTAMRDSLVMTAIVDNPVSTLTLNAIGRPHINAAAFSTDGAYWFYALGAFWTDSQDPPPAAGVAPSAAFVIHDVSEGFDGTRYYPGDGIFNPVLGAAVFIDNVPLQEQP